MKIWILQLLMAVQVAAVSAQEIDEAMMDKDLEVAENILSTLMKQSSSDQFMVLGRGREAEGQYLPNYGVVFSVSANQFKMFSYSKKDDHDEMETTLEIAGDSDDGKPTEYMIQTFKDFLADYGGMIRQLKPTDKILIKTESRNNRSGVVVFAGQKKVKVSNGISAEVSKADLEAYEKGGINRDQLLEKILVNENANDAAKEPQLEVFSSMLERLYEIDLTETYYMANTPDYDRMEKFGVTYYLKFYSSTVHDDDDYSLPTISKKHVSKAERNKIVEEMYPEFLKSFKQNILDYGHILKNIDPSEMLVFHVKLTSCEGCDMPAVIDVSLKKSVIEDYRNGKLSFDQANTMIEVKDVGD